MNHVLPHLLAGRILGIEQERIGEDFWTYSELLEIGEQLMALTYEHDPIRKFALDDPDGSTLLKAAVLGSMLSKHMRAQEATRKQLALAACSASACTAFVGASKKDIPEVQEYTDLTANNLLLALLHPSDEPDSEEDTK